MAAIHLGDLLPGRSSNQPGRSSAKHTCLALPRSAPPLFGLAPGGVYHAAIVANRAVRSYRTLSPLPGHASRRTPVRRYTLCGTFPNFPKEAGGRYPPPLFRGARTFLGVIANDAAARPPGPAYLAVPRSRSKSNWNAMARICPSISPSIFSGRHRRWKASTALCPSVMS